MSDYDSRYRQSGPGSDPEQPAGAYGVSGEQESPAEMTAHYSVGDELRIRRESLGKTIADVVDSVRIQSRYLEALEDGRLEDLPGTVYALGFVRTYADYLGLDGADVVARYKEETQGLKSQSYVMPEPLEEGKVPTAAILVGAIVLAAAAYGAWYFFSQPVERLAQQIPEVPERLAAVTGEPAPDAAPAVTTPAETAPPPAVAPPVASEGDAPPPPAVAMIPDTPAPAALPAEPAPATDPDIASATPSQPAPEPVPSAPPQPAAAADEPAPVPDVPAPQPDAPVPPAEVPETVATVAPPVAAADEEPREPRTYGLGNADARVIIIAVEDAWVEVTDSDDARLFSRVLRKGDRYRAPNRAGAKFVTGNAGGLEIMVDGELAPALGPPGQVRRDVKLDPDLLKAGRAWP